MEIPKLLVATWEMFAIIWEKLMIPCKIQANKFFFQQHSSPTQQALLFLNSACNLDIFPRCDKDDNVSLWAVSSLL